MRKFFMAAAMAVVALIGADSPAQGAFKLRISTDGGATFTTTIQDNMAGDNTGVTGLITTNFPLPGGGTVGFVVSSNQSLALPFGRLSQTELAFAGSTGFDSGASVFVIEVTDTGYIAPTGLSLLTSETSGTGLSGSNATLANVTFQSWANDPNLEFGTGPFTGGPQGPFVNTNFGGPLAPDTVSSSGTLTVPYSITSRFTISNVVIQPGGSLQLTGTATVTSLVPAPAGLVLALAGAPIFGLGAYIRRRRAVKA